MNVKDDINVNERLKEEIKLKNRIAILLLVALLFTIMFLLDLMGVYGFVFTYLPVVIILLGIILIQTGFYLKKIGKKFIWIFFLSGCLLMAPVIFYIYFFVFIPFEYGAPVPS